MNGFGSAGREALTKAEVQLTDEKVLRFFANFDREKVVLRAWADVGRVLQLFGEPVERRGWHLSGKSPNKKAFLSRGS